MPKIPTFTARGELGVLKLPRPAPEHFGGEAFKALGELGETFQTIDEKIRAVDEAVTGERIIRETATKADAELERLTAEGDHETFAPAYRQTIDTLRQGAVEQAKALSATGQKAIVPHLERVLGNYEIHANREARKLKANFHIAEVKRALPDLARLAVKGQTPEERARYRGEGVGLIRALSPYLDAPRLVEIEQGYTKEIEKEQSAYQSVGLRAKLDDLVNNALRDPLSAGLLHTEGMELIEQMDWLHEAEREKEKTSFKDDIWSSAVKGRIEADPNGTLAELKVGRYDKLLDQKSLVGLKAEAESKIEGLARKADAERKERERQIGKLVSDFEDARMAGFDWRGPVSEARLADLVKGTEHETKFLNVTGASGALAKFSRLPPIAQEEALRRMRQGAKTGFEAKFLGVLERAHEATRRGLESDPLSFAVGQRVVPAPPPLNLQDPASLQERSRLAGIAEQHYGRPVSPLSDDEVEQLRITIEKAPADGKALILRWLKTGFEDRQIKAIAGQLAKKKEDNVLALAIGLSAEAPQTASRILQGREILKDNPKFAPQGADMISARDAINTYAGQAYMHNPEHYAAVSEAALSIYAFKAWQARKLTYSSDFLDEAINEATGGLLTISRGFLRGGYKIQPPRPGMSETQFLALVKAADFSRAKGLKPEDIQRHGIFESIGDGRYLIRVGPGHVQGEKGPFILDLSRK